MSLITLTEGDDTYASSTAGDIIQGLGGNDTITASDGGNILWGGDGDDALNGGAGDDTLYGDNATNTIYHNTLNGRGGDDHIVSFSWYDAINAGSGNDYVESFAMTTGQTVDGGAGIDKISIRSLSSQAENINLVMGTTFSPTVGNAQGATYANFEVLEFYGGTGSNTIEGGSYADTIVNTFTNVSQFAAGSLKGRGGDDHLEFNAFPTSGTGIETVDGGAGTDTLFWSNGFGTFSTLNIDFATGKMKANGATFATFDHVENLNITTFSGSTGTVTITGGAGVETMLLYASSSNIHSNGGDDFITINSGSTTVDAGGGNDHVFIAFVDTDSNTVHGGIGDDSLAGGQGKSKFYGEAGDDSLGGQNGRTSLYGGNGDDHLSNTSSYSMTGTDSAVLDGGAGRDTLSIERSLGGTTYTADFSQSSVTLADGTQILSCEGVVFVASSGNDVLTASNDAGGYLVNKLLGLAGNDILTAGSNGATLDGSIGTNTLIAGKGIDRLVSGTASYINSTKGVTVDLTLVTAQLGQGDAKGDLLSFVQSAQGSDHNDSLTGNANANGLSGGNGDDALKGAAGHDTLAGGAGHDTFIYGAATESSGALYDAVTDFDANQDQFQVVVAVTKIDTTVGSGALSAASFDADLGTAIGTHLKATHTILYTPNSGGLSGKTFLVIDQNNQIGYQSGGDIVIDITGALHLPGLAIGDFTT